MNIDPLSIGEPYPGKLTEAVDFRLKQFQADYDELIRERGIVDFRKDRSAGLANAKIPSGAN